MAFSHCINTAIDFCMLYLKLKKRCGCITLHVRNRYVSIKTETSYQACFMVGAANFQSAVFWSRISALNRKTHFNGPLNCLLAAKNIPCFATDVDAAVFLCDYPYQAQFVHAGAYPVMWRVNPPGMVCDRKTVSMRIFVIQLSCVIKFWSLIIYLPQDSGFSTIMQLIFACLFVAWLLFCAQQNVSMLKLQACFMVGAANLALRKFCLQEGK